MVSSTLYDLKDQGVGALWVVRGPSNNILRFILHAGQQWTIQLQGPGGSNPKFEFETSAIGLIEHAQSPLVRVSSRYSPTRLYTK